MSDDLVFGLAFQTWADGVDHEMSWSADRMMQHALRDRQFGHVMISDPRRHLLSLLRRHAIGRSDGFQSSASTSIVHPLGRHRNDPVDLQHMVDLYRRHDAWLARQSRRRGLQEPVLVTCHPVHAAVASPSHWKRVVYYGWDDWEAHAPFRAWQPSFRWAYAEMARREVTVVAVSQTIVDKIGSARGSVVPNAVDGDDFANLPPIPSWFRDLTDRPICLYAGSLEGRIDVEALERAAAALPDWRFVLVGQMQEPDHFRSLGRSANVVIRERHPRPQVLAMMQAATVCVLAHRVTDMTMAMSPLKVYEYLASGTPVVATDLLPIRGISDRCLLAAPSDELAPLITIAAQMPRVSQAEMDAWRVQNSWDGRYAHWKEAVLGLRRSQGPGPTVG